MREPEAAAADFIGMSDIPDDAPLPEELPAEPSSPEPLETPPPQA